MFSIYTIFTQSRVQEINHRQSVYHFHRVLPFQNVTHVFFQQFKKSSATKFPAIFLQTKLNILFVKQFRDADSVSRYVALLDCVWGFNLAKEELIAFNIRYLCLILILILPSSVPAQAQLDWVRLIISIFPPQSHHPPGIVSKTA